MVDEQAKAAGHGRTSNRLPHRLRADLQQNIAALKQAFNADLKARWKRRWGESHRSQRMKYFDPSMPSNAFMKLSPSLRRAQTSIITYLRTGHAPLNRHLYRIGAADTSECPHCPRTEETVRHYLLDCPKYRKERHALGLKLLRRSHDMSYLLTSPKATGPLMTFVAATTQ